MSDNGGVIRIAVIGAGVIGREHIARVQRSPRCSLTAVVDPIRQSGPWFAPAECLPPVDGAIIATPNHLHVDAALPFLAKGLPVLIEKPIADSAEDAQRLLAHDTPILVGYHRRHSPALQAAHRWITEGHLGRIVTVTGITAFHKPDAYFDVPWRTGPAGGPILINLAHDIDSLRALAGEIESVHAIQSNRLRQLPVEDTAAVLLQFANGALGTLTLTDTAVAPWSWEQTSGENPLYTRDATQDCLFLTGTEGSLALPSLRWWRQTQTRSWSQPFDTGQLTFTPADPLERQLDHFCDIIERGATPLVPAREAIQSLRALLTLKAATAGQPGFSVPERRSPNARVKPQLCPSSP